MIYLCCDERRRTAVREAGTLNGIDFLEVHDDPADPPADRQRVLSVHLLSDLGAAGLGPANIRIEGGERIRDVRAIAVAAGVGPLAHVLTVEVDRAGDFSPYTLRLVQGGASADPPDDVDPALAAAEFSFKAECPTEFDCRPPRLCPPAEPEAPDIDYLARDFGTLRRVLLDRLSVLMPEGIERRSADLGVALVELLAYLGDHLSYRQDAIATEAYLGTARRRVSVRRHARLVDYLVDEGLNARVFIHLAVGADVPSPGPGEPPAVAWGTRFFTRVPGAAVRVDPPGASLGRAQEVFESLEAVDALWAAHNEIPFHTWSGRECCLPAGATRATLRGHLPRLAPGAVLVLEEVKGPVTGRAEDADPAHRHAARLVDVRAFLSPGVPLADPLDGQLITEVAWHDEDALPFAVCLSSRTDAAHGERLVDDVSVARGNVVLADHGVTVDGEDLGVVPAPALHRAATGGERCAHADPRPVPVRFRPRLAGRPVTQADPYDPGASAAAAMRRSPRSAVPSVALTSALDGDVRTWQARRDLLASDAGARDFAVEVEEDGEAAVRFGQPPHGAAPDPGMAFAARYRVGNGRAGNVGADAIAHVASPQAAIVRVRNPLAARGGRDPETLEQVRQRAPEAFRTQERAVTPDDHARMAERDPRVQRAAGTLRWTGSWHTAFVTVDRTGGLPVDAEFEADLRQHLERYRLAGLDLEVDGPRFVPLEIEMQVCVEPGHFRAAVKAALLDVFSSRRRPDGRLGVFHPDRFVFGQAVYLSPLYAGALDVSGVASATVTTFQRLGTPDPGPLAEGKLALGRLEIGRLDNDPNFPEHGVFRLVMGGGK